MSDPFDDWLRSNPDPVAIARGVTLQDIRLLRWNDAFAALLGMRGRCRRGAAISPPR